ncbi:MAG TPA: TonB family protein [Candidatus Eisenbacteria bacterium]|jgi:protein TonB
MKAAESLFEFMPYGAPELLESRRERMARALALGSLATLALIVSLGSVARLVAVPPVVIPVPHIEPHQFQRMPDLIPKAPVPSAPPTRPVADGVVVPVPEQTVVEPQNQGPTSDRPAGEAERPGDTCNCGTAPPAQEFLPRPDKYIYVEQLPEPVGRVRPIYPEIAIQAGVEGLVIVKALVGKNGRVLDVLLDRDRQVPMLNEAALAAARQWVFTPALASGKPVVVWTAIPFHFRLH